MNHNLFKYIRILVFGVLGAMALTMKTETFPGSFRITGALMIPVLYCAFIYIENRQKTRNYILILPAAAASFFYLMGRCFEKENSWNLYFQDVSGCLWFVVYLIGLGIVFYYLFEGVMMLFSLLSKAGETNGKSNRLTDFIFGKHAFIKCMVLILLSYLPVIIICYPGGSCVDVSYQISQAIGRVPFSTLHPILHTLFVGTFVNLGHRIFGSYDLGLYLQILTQCVILAAVMSFSIKTLLNRNIKKGYAWFLLCIYCFAPMYSNFATMTIKDTLFNTWILLYMTLLFRLLDSDTISVKISRILPIVLSAVLVMSFRNNGLIVVASCSLGLMIYFIFRGKKRKKIEVALYCVLPIVLFLILNQSLTMAFHAETFNSKEMLSIPFQQTARVIRDYKNEVSKQEWEILGAVLEDEKTLGELYDPNISDPVKRQFRSEATIGEIAAYLSLWMKWFFRHPGVYLEAFINHCYGWFDLGLRNSVRYEGRMDIFTTPYYGISNDKMLYYYYNLMNRFPITGLMENVGAYVWWLAVLSVYIFKNGNRKKALVFLLPLYASLLVCVASPACLLHPRYAFPILFTLPFLTGALIAPKQREMN